MSGTISPRPRPLTTLFTLLLTLTLFLLPARLPAAPAGTPAGATATAAAGSPTVSSSQVAILLPLGGTFSELGKRMREGFESGFNFATAESGLTVSVIYLDTESDPDTARTLVELLASEEQTLVAAGTPLNPCAWTASRAAEKNGLPLVIVGADQDNLVNEKSAFTFRTTRPRSAFRQLLSGFIKSRRPALQSVAVIKGEKACQVRDARRLRKLCAGLGLDLAIWKTLRSNESNFYDLLNLVKEQRPELILLATGPTAARKFFAQGRRLEIMPPNVIEIPDDCFPQAPTAAAPPVGLLRPVRWLPPTEEQTPYPELTGYRRAAAFATAQVIVAALEKTTVRTPAAAAAALEKISRPTIYGKIAFTGPGRGHQNQAPWQLATTTPEGYRVVYPGPAGKKK